MKVIWYQQALEGRERIAEYIYEYFGVKSRTRFLREVRWTTRMLKRTPNLGRIDPLFYDRAMTYRSIIINGLSKMVYYVKDDTIRIAAF